MVWKKAFNWRTRHCAARIFVCVLAISSAARGNEYHDPAGFRANLPEGWQAVQSKAGHFVLVSPDPQKYVFVQPVMNRTADCSATLRQALSGGGSQFAGVQGLEISSPGRGVAVARFIFQNGQVRGEMLCAETSSRGGTIYGLAAPAAEFANDLPMLMAVLKSFSFEAPSKGSAGGAGQALAIPRLMQWQEPYEMAYTMGVPEGWQVIGGIQRRDATHYTNGTQMSSPDGSAVIRIGDQRVSDCLVPGPNSMAGPGTQGYCQMQSSANFGSAYIGQLLARDLGLAIPQNGLQIAERPDIAAQAEESPRSMGIALRVSASELRFQGMQNGSPVTGSFLAITTFYPAANGQNFVAGTMSFGIRGFVGRPEQFGVLARLTGAVGSSIHINPVWYSQTQRINQQIAESRLAASQQQAQRQQQAFWDRMESSDQRREGMRDILGGTVRLSDGQGNQYEAKAGSNYYFRNDDAARTASHPGEAVGGTNEWPSPMVDLTPLEVVR